MKIIKTGQLPKDRIYIGTCSYCNTIMEAKQSELKHTSYRNEDDYTAYCMICNGSVSFRLKPPDVDYHDPRESSCYENR